MPYSIINSDVTDARLSCLYHAVLCDPPYELGFMGKKWDATGIAFDPSTWRGISSNLHPGGFLMAFASSRGWHRMACAIEDAGFIIHPTIFGWAFASGFPKATRIDTQIDAGLGVEQNVVGRHKSPRSARSQNLAMNGGWQDSPDVTAPVSEMAVAWHGHRYGLQALKPAVEPIIVAQKPYDGRPVDCISATGAGALNIDAGRIPVDSAPAVAPAPQQTLDLFGVDPSESTGSPHSGPGGRWPSNLILHHDADCGIDDCVDECAVSRFSANAGQSRSNSGGKRRNHGIMRKLEGRSITDNGGYTDKTSRQDRGTRARYFFRVRHQIDSADPIYYCPKASRRERDAGCADLPKSVFQSGCSGDMPISDTGIERDRFKVCGHNNHPTVKPIALTQYLASLLLPPDFYAPRRLLIPFSGSGSEMIGALLAGWDEVTGIEMDEAYAELAKRRIAHWTHDQTRI